MIPAMNKIAIIIKREYLTRVKNKTFIISTLLVPFLFIVIIFLSALAASWNEEESFTVKVKDLSGKVLPSLPAPEGLLKFEPASANEPIGDAEGLLVIPEDINATTLMLELTARENISLSLKSSIDDALTKMIQKIRLQETGISDSAMALLNGEVKISTKKITETGSEKTSTGFAAIMGYIMGLLIYMFMFIYGGFVMRGVIEEKTNRIMEVMVSTVKPFELMMGKIIAIAGVGLSQFLVWILLISIGSILAGSILGPEMATPQNSMGMGTPANVDAGPAAEILEGIRLFNPSLILYFLFYFLGGYLLYGAVFAAVGSSVDQESDAQQLMTPITILLVIPMIFIATILQNPNGTLAIAFSIIPFFAPMIMMVRLCAVDVPAYQLILSMVLLVFSFLGMIWVSGRIYRIGILMYGKKPTYKEIIRWAFSKD